MVGASFSLLKAIELWIADRIIPSVGGKYQSPDFSVIIVCGITCKSRGHCTAVVDSLLCVSALPYHFHLRSSCISTKLGTMLQKILS